MIYRYWDCIGEVYLYVSIFGDILSQIIDIYRSVEKIEKCAFVSDLVLFSFRRTIHAAWVLSSWFYPLMYIISLKALRSVDSSQKSCFTFRCFSKIRRISKALRVFIIHARKKNLHFIFPFAFGYLHKANRINETKHSSAKEPCGLKWLKKRSKKDEFLWMFTMYLSISELSKFNSYRSYRYHKDPIGIEKPPIWN